MITDVRTLCSQWASLEVRDGLLYRKKESNNSGRHTTIFQLVAPQEVREQAFKHLHSSKTGGHLGINRTLDSVRLRFYWPGCKTDIRRWCQICATCAQIKVGPRYKSAMHHVPSQGFLQARFGGETPSPKKISYSLNKFLLTLFLFTLSPLPLGYSPPKSFNSPPKGEILQETLLVVDDWTEYSWTSLVSYPKLTRVTSTFW